MESSELLRYGTLTASTVIFAGILFGVWNRKNRRIHIPMMLGCFVADMLLVLVIELNRQAIAQATSTTDSFLRFHIAVSVSAVVCYFVALVTGFRRRKGKLVLAHRVNAILFLFFRGTNWATAFFV